MVADGVGGSRNKAYADFFASKLSPARIQLLLVEKETDRGYGELAYGQYNLPQCKPPPVSASLLRYQSPLTTRHLKEG